MIGIDEKLKLLEPVMGTIKIAQLRQMYFFTDDYREKKELENFIDLLISQHVKTDVNDGILLPPPLREACQGDIDIGIVEYLKKAMGRFALRLKDINRHTGIFGSTGSGKTTLAKHLIRKLHERGIPFLIFDWEKSYRNIAEEFPDVQVFTVGADIHPLHINMLDVPPGITREEYAKSLIALLADDFLSGAGSDTMLLKYITTAYQEHHKPSFSDLIQIALKDIKKNMRGRSMLWKETVQRILLFLSIGASGNILDTNPYTRKPYPLDRLFSQNAVLEFGNIQSPRDRKFIMHCVINWLFHWLQSNGIESDKLNQVIVFEEFHNIALKGNEDNLISNLFRQCRKYGLGLIALDQVPSEIPNAIYANMNAKVSFTLATARDISAMSKAMNLTSDQTRYFGMLETGQAIINCKQRHQDSFLVRPPRPLEGSDENIPDEELRAMMKKFAGNPKPNMEEPENSKGLQCIQSIETSPPFAPLEKLFIADIIDHPFDGVDKRIKRLGLHPSVISDIHARLTDEGAISPSTIDGKKLFELTTEGKNRSESSGLKIKKQDSRGGLIHSYWINETAQFLKKLDFQPVLEKDNIDIQVSTEGIAIEIETGKSNIASNLLKLKNHLRLACQALSKHSCLMLATERHVESKIKQMAKDYPTNPPIRVMYVKDFFKLTKNQIISDDQVEKPIH